MKLIDFFDEAAIVNPHDFFVTYSPYHNLPGSIAYASSKNIIEKLNSDESVSVVITIEELSSFVLKSKGIIVSTNPQLAFYQLHNKLVKNNLMKPFHNSFIGENASIAESAIIHENVYIGEGVKVGNGAIIYENTYIGDHTIIEDNAIIGAKGMQNTYVGEQLFHVGYAGGVKIGNNCQILSNAIIQRPYQHYCTTIGNNVQVSVQVVIGHGVQIGNNTQIAGSSQVSGNAQIGSNVLIGPSTVISDGVIIKNGVNVKLGSTVIADLEEDAVVSGNFAYNHKKHLKELVKNNLR